MRPFVVASRFCDDREEIFVCVYPTAEQMIQEAAVFNGTSVEYLADAQGITQTYVDENNRTIAVVVRLAEPYLSLNVVAHEVNHAAMAIYGAHIGERVSRRAHFNHANEKMAYLYGELLERTVRGLRRRGYGVYIPA